MSDDVTIDRETAREMARQLRLDYCSRTHSGIGSCSCSAARVADLLDPKPRSLRGEVIAALYGGHPDEPTTSGAVLAVVADWLAAQPLTEGYPREPITVAEFQRRHDVRLLRGGDDA